MLHLLFGVKQLPVQSVVHTGFCWAVYLSVTGQGGYRTVFGSGTKLNVQTSK